MTGSYRFDHFLLDPADRQLSRDGAAVELNARYLDALTLLVREAGKLVTKDRFHDQVWRGVPVTDEALTQCIKTLRRQLGDDAGNPRFIETIPKHGYRFIAPVASGDESPVPRTPVTTGKAPSPRSRFVLFGAAGTVGAGTAGAIGGLIYGFAAASQSGVGAVSVLLVMICLTTLVALMGGAGVAFGIAAAGYFSGKPWQWSVLGGAAGGMAVGAIVKLLGLDAFNLLLGHTPGDFAGGLEGAMLGGMVGLGGWLAHRHRASLRRRVAIAAAAGAAGGIVIPLTGGRLMAGSLDSLARSFPESRLRLDPVGDWFGEHGFGLISQTVTGCLEGALFGGCVIGAMLMAARDA
ncbi:MAG: transcriptional regulator [Sphingomonas sp.]|uniref:winged helix-turn-helix domain-containing protein n=1 Tax=Sphingomonas sp. TaxID=28214 RepID=UPI0025E5E925|nr:transcriptional regulator [Sphingomonas sp.]MBX3564261.1 transcriptional regulator [Sphingomonas sp.]